MCGAGRGERSPDRANQRNGYRPRQWDTRAGTIGLNIPKLRKGSCFPTFPEPRRTGEKALMALALVARTNGAPMARSRWPASTGSPPVRSTIWSGP
jgi:transposase-like protein